MGGVCGTYGERRGAYSVLVWKSEGKNLLERPSRRWENIKMYLQDVRWETSTRSIWLRRDRWWTLANGITSVSIKCGEFLE